MARIMIFTGKGGVGKTSVAAAHASKSAQEGKDTLLVSTDMAHNLSDLFQVQLGKEACQVSAHLDVLEIDPFYVMEQDFRDIGASMMKVMQSFGMPAENLGALTEFPGMEELFSLLKIMDIYETGRYERLIIDCAPTGETLSLLKFPELLSWYMEKFFPIEKIALKVLRPVSKTLFKVELPDQKAMSDVERMYIRMNKLQSLLKDKEVSSVRLVSIPEKMVVEETKRNYMYMNLYGFLVDGLYINRVLPGNLDNPFFSSWKAVQERYIRELEEVFSHIPVCRIPWFDEDLNGQEGIERLAEYLPDKEVFQIGSESECERYEKTANGYVLKLFLPCAVKEELDLHESLRDLIIKAGNFKRNIPKPDVLRSYEIVGASLENEILSIRFEPKERLGTES